MNAALPKQDVEMGASIDFTGSGRKWKHRGEWVFEAHCKVTVQQHDVYLRAQIRPEAGAFALYFEPLFAAERRAPMLFASPEGAASWYEESLFAWSVIFAAGRLQDEPKNAQEAGPGHG